MSKQATAGGARKEWRWKRKNMSAEKRPCACSCTRRNHCTRPINGSRTFHPAESDKSCLYPFLLLSCPRPLPAIFTLRQLLARAQNRRSWGTRQAVAHRNVLKLYRPSASLIVHRLQRLQTIIRSGAYARLSSSFLVPLASNKKCALPVGSSYYTIMVQCSTFAKSVNL